MLFLIFFYCRACSSQKPHWNKTFMANTIRHFYS